MDEITTKIDSVIDLAAATPENKDLMQERLGRLCNEKREIEDRLRCARQSLGKKEGVT